eukprot:m.490854 g.490854  ORF g.490854 m.490854 type:complete len:144 (+) comp28766_c0_seq1:94-525(+)
MANAAAKPAENPKRVRWQPSRPSFGEQNHDDAVLTRKTQWMYIGPILAAPVAHIAVSMYRKAKTAHAKRLLMGVGVIGATAASIGMRVYLMAHAGYTGGAAEQEGVDPRRLTVVHDGDNNFSSPTGKKESLATVATEILKGFG